MNNILTGYIVLEILTKLAQTQVKNLADKNQEGPYLCYYINLIITSVYKGALTVLCHLMDFFLDNVLKLLPTLTCFTVYVFIFVQNAVVFMRLFGYVHLLAAKRNRCFVIIFQGPRWQSGNTLASHLWGRGSIPSMASSGKAGSCLPLVGSLQYRTLTNCMYWFPLPFQLPVVI